MELANAAELGKIQRFGRNAQVCSAVLLAAGIVGGPLTVLYVLTTPDSPGLAALWWNLSGVIEFSIAVAIVGYLYALFGALSKGEIYSLANVRRIRHLGELLLAVGVFRLVLPMASLALLNAGALPAAAVGKLSFDVRPDAFSVMISAGFVLLASWIMEIGRRTSEDAERLRSDAELVV